MSAYDLEQVYAEYSPKVLRYIRARVQGQANAEDLCSDVFEKVFHKIGEYDQSKAAVGTWIFTITRNTVIDYFRRSRPADELDENMADDEFEVDENILTGESLSELAAALRKLPQQLMDIVVLRYYDNKPLTEIAKMMGLSYGAIKLRHQNALMLLREYLGSDDD